MNHYEIYGENKIKIVIEMGLSSCISEWIPMAKKLKEYGGVLLYERAGINKSLASESKRTPGNIAVELYQLLGKLDHEEQIILIAHSQGGLYAAEFCRRYPQMIEKLILLDPLSPRDNDFKENLTPEEYRKSGVDKSANYKPIKTLAKMKLGFITKSMLKSAPPFYYYHDYTKEETDDILGIVNNVQHISTVMEEYALSHQKEYLQELLDKEQFPNIPITLITHSSELAIKENMEFGHNSREFAEKVEEMWQGIMKDYLQYSNQSEWISASKSSHFIHLQEPELIVNLIAAR